MGSRYYVRFEHTSISKSQNIYAREDIWGPPIDSHTHECYITASEYASADEAILAVLSENDGVLVWSAERGEVDEDKVDQESDEIESGFSYQLEPDDEDNGPLVCLTHLKFLPCRQCFRDPANEGVSTSSAYFVEIVRKYQLGKLTAVGAYDLIESYHDQL